MTEAQSKVRAGNHYAVEIGGEWHVLFAPDDLPNHFLSVARFQDKTRATNYADVEQTMLEDDVTSEEHGQTEYLFERPDADAFKRILPREWKGSISVKVAGDQIVISRNKETEHPRVLQSADGRHRFNIDTGEFTETDPELHGAEGEGAGCNDAIVASPPIQDPGASLAPAEDEVPAASPQGEVSAAASSEASPPQPDAAVASQPAAADREEAAPSKLLPVSSRPYTHISIESQKKRDAVYKVLTDIANPEGLATIAHSAIASKANILLGDVSYCIAQLVQQGLIAVEKLPTKRSCATYRIISAAKNRPQGETAADPIPAPPVAPVSPTEIKPSWAGKPAEEPQDRAIASAWPFHLSCVGRILTVGRVPYHLSADQAKIMAALVNAEGREVQTGVLRMMVSGAAPKYFIADIRLRLKGAPIEILDTETGYRLAAKTEVKEAAE